MFVCETLLPDVVAPEVHWNDCSYVRELSGPTFGSISKNFAWWVVTRRTSKNHKTVKIAGGRLHRDGLLPGTIQYIGYLTWHDVVCKASAWSVITVPDSFFL